MIYDEAMEINFSGLSFFFFFKYESSYEGDVSDCEITLNGRVGFFLFIAGCLYYRIFACWVFES